MGSPLRARQLIVLALLPAAVLCVLAIHHLAGSAMRAGHPLAPARTEAEAPAALISPPTCVGPAPPAQQADFEQRVVELVNRQRRAAALPPLKRAEPLTGSARWFARDMAVNDYFAEDHDSYYRSGGRLLHACNWSARVGRFYEGWTELAENIAAGYDSPEQVVEGWMSSSGHRAKILSRGSWETGVGYWSGGREGSTWVQDFGRRDGVFPVVIDDEAASTRSTQVPLHVYGTWREMRLRNDDDGFFPWRSFSSDFDWTLEDEAGLRTVTVEMRDGPKTASASDVIRLERQLPTAAR